MTGSFVDGVWKCNCNPPLPAKRLQTKKNNANKGRWFWKCPKEQKDIARCSFFLWTDEAQRREAAALNNGGIEPNDRRATPPPPPYTVEPQPGQSSRKRTRAENHDSDDENSHRRVSGQLNHEFHQVMSQVETPTRVARTINFTTPATTRPQSMEQSNASSAYGLQTPQTNRRPLDDPFAPRPREFGAALLTPSKPEDNQTQQTATPSSSYEAPTPSRPKNTFTRDLEQDVLDLLHESDIRFDGAFELELKRILSIHANKATGFKLGRDVNQATVKAREAKITELTHRLSSLDAEVVAEKAKVTNLNLRINTLEAELVAEKALVESLRWDMQSET